MVTRYLQQCFDREKPYFVSDIVDILRTILNTKPPAPTALDPRLSSDQKTRKAGKIFVDMTGGTEGSREIFESLTSGE